MDSNSPQKEPPAFNLNLSSPNIQEQLKEVNKLQLSDPLPEVLFQKAKELQNQIDMLQRAHDAIMRIYRHQHKDSLVKKEIDELTIGNAGQKPKPRKTQLTKKQRFFNGLKHLPLEQKEQLWKAAMQTVSRIAADK